MDARDMIREARDLVNDPDGTLFTDAKVLDHLNRALRDVTSRARTIREVIYRRANSGQSVYALPEGFLGNDKFSWLYANYWYPLHRRTLSQVEYINNSNILRSWRPFYYDVWGRTREERIVASVDKTSSSLFESEDANPFRSPDFPTNDQTFGFKFVDGLAGIDSVRVRDMIINMTDGSEGFVTERRQEVPGQALFGYARLLGGKRTGDDSGLILEGDKVRITSPNVSGHALRISPPPVEDSEPGEEALWMYLSRRHYIVTQGHLNDFNDGLELDIELETPALECMIYYMRREELGASDRETMAQKQIFEGAYHRALPDIRQRNREHESTWGKPSIAASRQNLELSGISTSDGHALNNVFIG